MSARVRIVGCGRQLMGDDQAGLGVAQYLRGLHLPDTIVVCDESPGSELAVGLEAAVGLLIVVDAAPADATHAPGSFVRIDYRAYPERLISSARGDTHSLSVAHGLQLAGALGLLPEYVWVYALFGSCFERSSELTCAVSGGLEVLTERIAQDVNDWLAQRGVGELG